MPLDVVNEGKRIGVKLTVEHAEAAGGRSGCACHDCLTRVLREIGDVLEQARRSPSVLERLSIDEFLDDPHWNEGDLLALLWQGARAESSRL